MSSDFVPASREGVAVSTKSSSSPTIALSSLPPLITPFTSVLGNGEASELVERTLATQSSSKANQLEFVWSELLNTPREMQKNHLAVSRIRIWTKS